MLLNAWYIRDSEIVFIAYRLKYSEFEMVPNNY
jgi:hypothetical protein